ncbi:MAG: GtrA family protein [Halieaceae bacterium]
MYQELIKYGIAGGLAFACDFSVLYVLTEFFGMHYLISNGFGYFCGLAVAYALNSEWVFSHRRFKNRALEFTLFTLIVLVGLGLSELLMALLVEAWAINYLHAKIVSSFFVMFFNYLSKKFLLFSPALDSRPS